jgi:hypothetical protein
VAPFDKIHATIKLSPPRTGSAKKSALVGLDQIDFPSNGRPTHADKVSEWGDVNPAARTAIAADRHRTQWPLHSRRGRHRIEAMRVIGKERVPVRVFDFNDIEARLWTISENLHYNELNALDRAEQVAEFLRLSEEMLDSSRLECANSDH